jgi:predicted RNase H-like HicB family nuclease
VSVSCRSSGEGVDFNQEVLSVRVETEQETDGRWIAEVPDLPGVLVYSDRRDTAVARAQAMALRVIADRLEHGERVPDLDRLFAVRA